MTAGFRVDRAITDADETSSLFTRPPRAHCPVCGPEPTTPTTDAAAAMHRYGADHCLRFLKNRTQTLHRQFGFGRRRSRVADMRVGYRQQGRDGKPARPAVRRLGTSTGPRGLRMPSTRNSDCFSPAAAAVCSALAGPVFAQSAEPPVDRLGISGPIEFAATQYRLAWSAQPSSDYIEHQYLPSGQKPETYADMIGVEPLTAGISSADAVEARTRMLDRRKATDSLVDYRLFQNPNNGRAVPDFLMSDERSGVPIVEWAAHRCVPVTMRDGKAAVILIAIGRSHHGDEANDFLKALTVKRIADIDTLVNHAVPGAEPVNQAHHP